MKTLRHLKAAGVDAKVVRQKDGPADTILDVPHGGKHYRFLVEERRRAPYPSEVDSLESTRRAFRRDGLPLLVAPFITEGAGKQLIKSGWSWADDFGNFDIRAKGLKLQQRRESQPPTWRPQALPRGSGSLVIVRSLIRHGEASGATPLARAAGVSQPRASQVLVGLESLGLIKRKGVRGWQANREALLERFLADYRGPQGTESFFQVSGDLAEIAADATASLRRRRKGGRFAISGDVGPGHLVAWRRKPATLVVYTETDVDLKRPLDATPVDDPARANLIVRVPADTSIFPAEPLSVDIHEVVVPLVDPTQLVWDLQQLGGDQRAAAADKLRNWLLAEPR